MSYVNAARCINLCTGVLFGESAVNLSISLFSASASQTGPKFNDPEMTLVSRLPCLDVTCEAWTTFKRCVHTVNYDGSDDRLLFVAHWVPQAASSLKASNLPFSGDFLNPRTKHEEAPISCTGAWLTSCSMCSMKIDGNYMSSL